MKNADMPAMPTKGGMVFYIPKSGFTNEEIKAQLDETIKEEYHGLTKRELLAAMALQGMLSGRLVEALSKTPKSEEKSYAALIATGAIEMANALLEALEEKQWKQ